MNDKTVPKNILIVDDDDVDIRLYQRAFNINEIFNPLFIAHDGVQAIDLLKGTNEIQQITPLPEVILLNIQMPKMDGIEFLKFIRNDPHTKHLSISILTTEKSNYYLTEAYNYNVAGYIVKPFTFLDLTIGISVIKNLWILCRNI